MKKILLIIILIIPLSVFSQNQKQLAKFNITESTINNYDNTQFDIERGGYFTFYENANRKLCLANVSENWNQQSYGQLLNLTEKTYNETSTSYKISIFSCRWKYYNSYDNNSGYATIQFSKTYKPQGVVFTLTMILPNLDKISYVGYMEGSLNFDNY
jgi:hypothetical protein